jgi:hypothetical protein
VVFPRRTPLLTFKQAATPLFELSLPESFTQQGLAAPPRRRTPLMGFRSLQHFQEPQVHLTRALPSRYVPPSGFGYPPGGLLPAIPGRFCFTPAALVGFTLRSFLLPAGSCPFPEQENPLTVSPDGIPTPKRGPARQAAVPGFRPPESPWRRHAWLTRPALDAPLGFPPLGSATSALARISPRLLSRAFRTGLSPGRRRPRVSIGVRSAPPSPW